jgi:hypothetical protein
VVGSLDYPFIQNTSSDNISLSVDGIIKRNENQNPQTLKKPK